MTVQGQARPKDFQALRTAIAQRAEQLPKRLMQVAGYALENPDEIAFGTVASIAASAEVQPSALVRFSRALGYQGFTDLQDVFRSRLRDRVLNYDERLAQMRDHGIADQQVGARARRLSRSRRALDRGFRDKVDHEAIERAVGILAAAETIYLIGLQALVPDHLLHELRHGQARRSATSWSTRSPAWAPSRRASSRRSDAVLAISFTPYASETVALTASAKARGAQDRLDHRFGVLADRLAGRRAARGREANFEGFRSMAATMALAMTLTVAVAARRRRGVVETQPPAAAAGESPAPQHLLVEVDDRAGHQAAFGARQEGDGARHLVGLRAAGRTAGPSRPSPASRPRRRDRSS